MRNFIVEIETDPVEEYKFAGNQAARAETLGVTRVFVWRWIVGTERLPQYIRHAIQIAGYRPFVLGGTTYRHSVIGLTPEYEHALIAIDGDCAKGGLSNKTSTIPFGPQQATLVRDLLQNQLAWEMYVHFHRDQLGKPDGLATLDRLDASHQALLDAEIFTNKYHCRTTWALATRARGSRAPFTRFEW